MIKMTILAAGFAAAMLMGAASGRSAAAVGCEQAPDCRDRTAKPMPNARIETVNVAASALLRQIVGDATARGNQVKH